eukprot:TRINITY_DN2001_c0_g1_i2.p1 TRINITY_DN2001_c0_g1~~TRINITY_DN2001_c0_g1_i2.p1  ORF type:complete len:164 (+),score=46.21 TRINITY_DN2001_c0_g1_i2:157-648(+)
MVVDYTAHGLANPKAWNRPASRIYNVNRSAGSFYYEPMLEYIDRKSFMGADTASKAVQMHTVQNRKRVEFPNAHEMPSSALTVDSFGPLRLDNFLTTYRAKQMKQRNTKTVRVKNEIVRQSKSSVTLDDKRTSTMIRDQYINMLSLMYQGGVGRMEAIPDIKY